MASRSIVESFGKILQGDASSINNFGANTSNTQAVSTPLVSLTGVPNIQTGFEGSPYFHFSLSPALDGDLAAGLQSLLGNVTLAFVTEQAATTRTEVVVTPNNTQYHYVSWRLGLIYGIVFGFALVVIGHGLFCLWKNRTVAVFDLQNILEMTAGSTRLRESVGSPAFGSTLVRGVSFSEKDGTFRRVVFDVSEPS
ncbi:hypothetical protein D9757_004549 [Collybiopsis confluens]|uniref:Uncharacterized protein n=1 Tax=Collybiopsis confluens TaxID=2823264 RepID=A0A8H5MEI5_9AGAR|nr:hypothetical protein D9757_004549 [Collybiopsis confluens]